MIILFILWSNETSTLFCLSNVSESVIGQLKSSNSQMHSWLFPWDQCSQIDVNYMKKILIWYFKDYGNIYFLEMFKAKGDESSRGWDGWIASKDMNLSKLQWILKNREAWYAAAHGVAKSWIQLSNRTTTINIF